MDEKELQSEGSYFSQFYSADKQTLWSLPFKRHWFLCLSSWSCLWQGLNKLNLQHYFSGRHAATRWLIAGHSLCSSVITDLPHHCRILHTHTHTNPLHTFIHSCIISCSIYYPLNPPSFFTAVSWAHIVGIRHMISSPGISRKFSIKHLIHCFIIRCRQCPRAMAEPTTRIYCYMLDCFPLSPACRTRTSTSACFRKRKT